MGKATIFISGTVSQMPRFREITTKDGKRTKMTFNVPADHGFGEHKSTTFYECDHWMPTSERGINYLLNVGPDALGRIPAPACDILCEVGRRTKTN